MRLLGLCLRLGGARLQRRLQELTFAVSPAGPARAAGLAARWPTFAEEDRP